MSKHIRASDLVAYARAAIGGGYCFGSSGEICSLSRRQQWAEWNPSQRENLLTVCAKWDGKKVWDCSGLFRGAWRTLWQYRSGGATTIWREWLSEKGEISPTAIWQEGLSERGEIGTMPDIPGVLLFRGDGTTMQHIGLSLGDGWVVDARGSKQGVLHTAFQVGYTWTHWGLAEDVDYADELPPIIEIPPLWTGTVKTKYGKGISLWQRPTNQGQAVCSVPEGAAIGILSDIPDGSYIEAQYAGRQGYANLQYVIPPDGEEPAFGTHEANVVGVKIGLNLRTGPALDRNTILLIPPGAVVEVYPEMGEGAFAYVRYEGRTGYCTARYLVRSAQEAVG